MGKRGFLLAEETLKIILAVIAIGFLAYLLFSIYAANRDSRNLELARSSLDFLIEEINDEKTEVEIYNPGNWVILSWSGIEGDDIPLSCSNIGWESCICMTKDLSLPGKGWSRLPGTASEREKLLERSDEGVCRNNPEDFSVKEPIKISSPPITLEVDYENKIIEKAEVEA